MHRIPALTAFSIRALARCRAASPFAAFCVAIALLTGTGAASAAGLGVRLLNLLASMRGHRAMVDHAYGPLDRQRFDLYTPSGEVPSAGGTPGRDATPSAAPTGLGPSSPSTMNGAPLIVFVYGGSWDSGERADYRFAGEALASRGFTVMVVDYRLSPEARYPAFVEDTAAAAAFALDHAGELGADPHRVFLFGHSAGAYNAAMCALDPRWLAVTGHAPSELAGWIGLAGPYDFLPIGDPNVQVAFDWPDTTDDSQPTAHVADLSQPVPAFLGAGAHDTTVDPVRNTEALAAALGARGTDLRATIYPHVGHALLLGALQWPFTVFAPVLDDAADFIRETPAARGAPASNPSP